MMWLMEQPYTIAAIGCTIIAVLFAGLLKTGKSVFLYLGIAAILSTLGMIALERFTITPREEVRATLHLIRHELEEDNVSGVLQYVSEGRPKIANEAKHYMGLVETEKIDIKNNLKIELVSEKGMDLAEARFNCVVHAKLEDGGVGIPQMQDRFPFFFVVRFKLEDDFVWRVRSYEMQDPRRGMINPPGT